MLCVHATRLILQPMSYNSRSTAASAATKLLFWWRPLSNGFVCMDAPATDEHTHTLVVTLYCRSTES